MNAPVKKVKGRAKNSSGLTSKMIKKEERKRGRPRKNMQIRKNEVTQLPNIARIHQNPPKESFPHPQTNEDSEAFVPFDLPIKGHHFNEEIREQKEIYDDLKYNNMGRSVLTRRDHRSMKKETWPNALSNEERMTNIEEMISCLGMMVFALHKKTVNKDKKQVIDEHIRRGFNAETARLIKESMLRDSNYFEKTRRNSIHYPNESMGVVQGSVKQ